MSRIFERYLGSKESMRLVLNSGDGDEYPGCKLDIQFGRFGLYIHLPQWVLKPEGTKVQAKYWSEADIKRLGRDWYMDYKERSYGITKYENHVSILYGRQTHDSSTEQRKGFFLPWSEYRMVRHALFGAEGEKTWEVYHWDGLTKKNGHTYEALRDAEEKVSKRVFRFNDYDGEVIDATTHIEERTWYRGDKWMKWIAAFSKDMFRRSLSIEFSKETGPRKGSWKGGTLGHGIEMKAGETHEEAFKRYCVQNQMKFMVEVKP